jgi:Do/DeqQ family serine protease
MVKTILIMKTTLKLIFSGVLGGLLVLFAQSKFNNIYSENNKNVESAVQTVDYKLNSFNGNRPLVAAEDSDFTVAAEKTIHAVVHVKNTSVKSYKDPFSSFFFGGGGEREYSQVGTGSGVIISADGYIITNNHVIDGASEIEITLNDKRKFDAEVIGADSNSDIALLKIDAKDLNYIPFGDSDFIKVGEWVLAVGNPYNLTSTVTAGIISAKGRDLQGTFSTDSFIQTDAAVNPGNSGGALVNTRGELIGINTAISSQTGGFVGYSFAVPSNIARKIVDDFMEYGAVQKVILGIRTVPDEEEKINGVQIAEVTAEGDAKNAGLESGDIIVRMDQVEISDFSDLKGYLNSKRPGDRVEVQVNRDGELISKQVLLSKDETLVLRSIGLIVENISKQESKKLGIKGGVAIKEIANEYLEAYGIKKGDVIYKLNQKEVLDVDDLQNILEKKSNSDALFLEIFDENGDLQKYVFR